MIVIARGSRQALAMRTTAHSLTWFLTDAHSVNALWFPQPRRGVAVESSALKLPQRESACRPASQRGLVQREAGRNGPTVGRPFGRTTSCKRQAKRPKRRIVAMIPGNFHPAVAAWFSRTFSEPTASQRAAWPAIAAGHHTLIAAPTGSGKTLAAFLAAIDALVREAVTGALADGVQVVYVSPLKALSNDIHRNLDAAAARHRRGTAQSWVLPAARDPCAGAYRRHAADRARGHAQGAAAYPGNDSGVAVPAADQRFGTRDAGEHPQRHRRRNPCGRRHQARLPPCAVAGAARAPSPAAGCSASACPRRKSPLQRSHVS